MTHWESMGNGSNLVLVHGLGLNRHLWRWQAPALAKRYRVITYDLIGHGESGKQPSPHSIDDFVTQLRALVDELGLDGFGLVGFSLGGLIAQAFALAHPAHVRALAILHAAHDRTDAERSAVAARADCAEEHGPKHVVAAALERWFTPGFALQRPDLIAQFRMWIEANDGPSFAAAYRVLAEADSGLAQAIGYIQCPTLVLTGSKDRGNSPQMAQRMAQLIPNAECHILPGLRHMALVEEPQSTLIPLLSFLDRTLGKDHPTAEEP